MPTSFLSTSSDSHTDFYNFIFRICMGDKIAILILLRHIYPISYIHLLIPPQFASGFCYS